MLAKNQKTMKTIRADTSSIRLEKNQYFKQVLLYLMLHILTNFKKVGDF